MFFAFDLLASGNDDLTDRPYVERRQMLSALPQAQPLIIPPYWDDAKPVDMLAAAAENGVEGVVAKRLDSPYVSGRSSAWIKSPVRRSCELVIVGWWFCEELHLMQAAASKRRGHRVRIYRPPS